MATEELTAQVMVNLHLAPFPRPVTSLIADFPLEQADRGWQARACPSFNAY